MIGIWLVLGFFCSVAGREYYRREGSFEYSSRCVCMGVSGDGGVLLTMLEDFTLTLYQFRESRSGFTHLQNLHDTADAVYSPQLSQNHQWLTFMQDVSDSSQTIHLYEYQSFSNSYIPYLTRTLPIASTDKQSVSISNRHNVAMFHSENQTIDIYYRDSSTSFAIWQSWSTSFLNITDVLLSDDGNVLVIGHENDGVYVYRQNSSGYQQLDQVIKEKQPEMKVSLTRDKEYLVVRSSGIKIYAYNGSSFEEQQQISYLDGCGVSSDPLVSEVCISDDGYTFVRVCPDVVTVFFKFGSFVEVQNITKIDSSWEDCQLTSDGEYLFLSNGHLHVYKFEYPSFLSESVFWWRNFFVGVSGMILVLLFVCNVILRCRGGRKLVEDEKVFSMAFNHSLGESPMKDHEQTMAKIK